jgi:hypothetical protein
MYKLITVACLGLVASTAFADTLSRSVDVPGTPRDIWSMIGPFCAIKDWLPPVGSCAEDGQKIPTRTLVTRDGSATFIERQSARSDSAHFYTYTFLSSPLPVGHYTSTIRVTARTGGGSTVTWRGTYAPAAGKSKDARQALTDIYAAGLDSIRQQAIQRYGAMTSSGALQ